MSEETPTPDELAAELAELETNAGNAETGATEPETAPDPEPAPEAPADPEPTPEPDPPPAEPEANKTIAPPRSTAQADKKAADTGRRKAAIAASPEPAALDEAEEKRKAGIQEQLAANHADLEEALEAVEACKARARELMAELYPHATESDKLVDAVKGHIKAQKKIRANRASSPERIKEILAAAGKAPIDAAFHRQRARGMSRPSRTPVSADTGDQGGGSDANASSE